MPFSRLRKGAFCIFLNPRLNGKPGVVHLYWQLMARRDNSVATKRNLVEILRFRHFSRHVVFDAEGDKFRNKRIEDYITVSVVIDMECGNTKN